MSGRAPRRIWYDAKASCPPPKLPVMFRMGDGRELQGIVKEWAGGFADWWKCSPSDGGKSDVIEWRFLGADEKPHEWN